MNILVLMAGQNNDNYDKHYPSCLVEIQNKPLVQRIIESLQGLGGRIICVVRKEDQENFFLSDVIRVICPSSSIIEISGNTKGAVCSALFAIDLINNDDDLLILNGTQLIKTDIEPAVNYFKKNNYDAGIITFTAIHPKYSSVLLDEEGFVVQTSEKRPISNLASSGCCYFKKGSDFIKGCFAVIEKDVNFHGNYYISSVFNELVLKQQKIATFDILKKDYINLSDYLRFDNYLSQRRNHD